MVDDHFHCFERLKRSDPSPRHSEFSVCMHLLRSCQRQKRLLVLSYAYVTLRAPSVSPRETLSRHRDAQRRLPRCSDPGVDAYIDDAYCRRHFAHEATDRYLLARGNYFGREIAFRT